jgi:hypothetical protein
MISREEIAVYLKVTMQNLLQEIEKNYEISVAIEAIDHPQSVFNMFFLSLFGVTLAIILLH